MIDEDVLDDSDKGPFLRSGNVEVGEQANDWWKGSQRMVYRLVVKNTGTVGSPFNTGANYPACSPTNPAACDPQDFQTMDDVFAYAQQAKETVVLVANVDRAWAIVNGAQPDPSEIQQQAGIDFSNPLLLAGVGFLAWKLIK